MDDDLPINDRITLPGYELWFTASRASGPGGQHVNTSSTRVTLHWSVDNSAVLTTAQKARVRAKLANRINSEGVLQVSSEAGRSQHDNKEAARARLAELVAEALVVQKRRLRTRPTLGSQRRRVESKKQRGEVKKMRKKPRPPE
jgi:ribosome-associated protein